jgi:hypothetical protein
LGSDWQTSVDSGMLFGGRSEQEGGAEVFGDVDHLTMTIKMMMMIIIIIKPFWSSFYLPLTITFQ